MCKLKNKPNKKQQTLLGHRKPDFLFLSISERKTIRRWTIGPPMLLIWGGCVCFTYLWPTKTSLSFWQPFFGWLCVKVTYKIDDNRLISAKCPEAQATSSQSGVVRTTRLIFRARLKFDCTNTLDNNVYFYYIKEAKKCTQIIAQSTGWTSCIVCHVNVNVVNINKQSVKMKTVHSSVWNISKFHELSAVAVKRIKPLH